MANWRHILRPEASKSDLNDELESHLALATADKCDGGMDPERARREAEREFGNVALIRDVARSMWGWTWLEWLGQDLKYALRQLRRSPGFALTVILTLALGIAAATAMFTVVDHVLLRPLPYPHPEQLVALSESGKTGHLPFGVPYLDLQQWAEQGHTLASVAYYAGAPGRGQYLETENGSHPVSLATISSNLFGTLGASPALGAGFAPGEENNNLMVLSDAVWRQMYGGNPGIVGKSVRLNDQSYFVVGVMPPGFAFPQVRTNDGPQVWTAAQLKDIDRIRNNFTPQYQVIARLRGGVQPAKAEAELSALQTQNAKGYADPDTRAARSGVIVRSYADSLVAASLKKALLALLAASGVLWLIACVNVTNLLLARGSVRRREIAMRGALGASRWRISQQLLVEGLVLSATAALIGISLAFAAIGVLQKQLSFYLPPHGSIHPNGTVLLALVGLTLFSAMISSTVPAWLAALSPIEPVLKQGGQQGGTSRNQNRARNTLVVAEIAMSLTLLIACGLLLRTIYSLRHVPLGFRTDHIIVANLSIPSFRFSGQSMTSGLYEPLLERAQHLAGVQAAGLMTEVPLGQSYNVTLSLRDDQRKDGKERLNLEAAFKAVTPSMQRIFGFQMLRGRFFNDQDTAGSQPVVVVNRAFAKIYAPEQQDIGKLLGRHLLNLEKDKPMEIVGILDDERQRTIAEPSQPEVEVSIPQLAPESGFYKPLESGGMDLAVRTSRAPASVIPELRAILREASPELADATFTTMDQLVEDSYRGQTLAAHLLEVFGATAFLLCIAGLYGLLAYVVTQRTREIGLRIILGASRGNVLWLVLRQAIVVTVAGTCIGAISSLAIGRAIRSYLYGVSAYDGWTLSAVALLLLMGGVLAGYLPARRAARVNPMDALRAE